MNGETPPSRPTDLHEAATHFLDTHPACLDPYLIHDRCDEISEAFAAHLTEAGIPATVVFGFRFQNLPDGTVLVLGGHAAVQTGTLVYDWTARQFNPTAPVPLVLPYDQWRQTWKQLPSGDRNRPIP